MSTAFEDEGIVDVERKRKNVEYVLDDPTLIPPEFLNWMKRYIEQSGITLPASSIFGITRSTDLLGLPPGLMLLYASGTIPRGGLACTGQSVSRTRYDRLFNLIGISFGSVDANHFNVPNLAGPISSTFYVITTG